MLWTISVRVLRHGRPLAIITACDTRAIKLPRATETGDRTQGVSLSWTSLLKQLQEVIMQCNVSLGLQSTLKEMSTRMFPTTVTRDRDPVRNTIRMTCQMV